MKTSFNGAIREIERVSNPWVIFTVGVPGCGKSTFIRKLVETGLTPVIASTDDMLDDAAKRMGITYKEAFDRFMKDFNKDFKRVIETTLNQGQNLIIDRTQVGKKARREHLLKVPDNYTTIALTFDVNDQLLAQRLEHRAKTTGKWIPPFVMESMTKRYETPSRDEGFDLLFTIENNHNLQGSI